MKVDDLERSFRLVFKQSGITDQRTFTAISKLRDQLELDLITNFDSAIDAQIDIKLWKVCHYKIIEEYRKQLKQVSGRIKAEKNSDNGELYMKLAAGFRFYKFDKKVSHRVF